MGIKNIYNSILSKYEEDVNDNPSKLRAYHFIPLGGPILYMDANQDYFSVKIMGKALFATAFSVGTVTATLKGIESLLQ